MVTDILKEYILDENPNMDSLAAILGSGKYNFTDILRNVSHVFCENERCALFTPSRMSQWRDTNRELFESEVHFFHKLLLAFPNNFDVDREPYGDIHEDVGVDFTDENVKIRQMYTMIYNFDDC